MTRKFAVTAILVLLIGIVTLSACQPATPTPVPPTLTPTMIDAVYYRDTSAGGKTSYDYIKFYGNGRATQVEISPTGSNAGSAVEVYNNIAATWLEFPPPNPAYGGTYTVRGSDLSLVLISNLDTNYMNGTYAADHISVSGSDGVHLQYQLLPLP